MNKEIDKIKEKVAQLEKKLLDPAVQKDKQKLKDISQKYSRLKEKLNYLEEIEKIDKLILKTKPLLLDKELSQIAQEEINNLEKRKKELLEKINPKSEKKEKKIIMEIRAGAGGEESALFASDLFRMYSRFAQKKGWDIRILDKSQSDLKGFKEIVFSVQGKGVWENLKYEAGVHRVQRIPETEKSGRVHTSTASVAVLDIPEEKEIEIKPEDLKIDTFRSSGHGGQNVQKVETGVRITHLPTNIVVTCQTERSQYQNKMNALNLLKARIKQKILSSQEKQTINQRRSQIGQAKRAEKIRTYNFPQNRVTDHRINKSWHNLEEILQGELEDIIESLKKADTSNK
ncbi:peptide chain release factor 1 [bacterium]|nr:peptide chain release factor 1 [bacterium]